MIREHKDYRNGTTPYYEEIVDALIRLQQKGHERVSQIDVAGEAEKNVTEALRRALNYAIGQGAIYRKDEKTDRGGVRAYYRFTENFIQYVLSLPIPEESR